MRYIIGVVAIVALLAAPAAAQSGAIKGGASETGAITGRVVDGSGRPIFNADVTLGASCGDGGYVRVQVATDEDGAFRATGLSPCLYSIDVSAPGYVYDFVATKTSPGVCVGQTVTLTMSKGAVVTGKVTRADGTPVIATPVRAWMVRDGSGRRTDNAGFEEALSDDRGVYRIYGLEPGSYVVCAGGPARSGLSGSPFTRKDAPTFYPSATLEGAGQLTLQAGQEATGIDIIYRAEAGHRVSGTAVGTGGQLATITIRNVTIGATFDSLRSDPSTGRFESSMLPDGDYELSGWVADGGSAVMAAEPVVFKVHGADVDALALTFERLASVSGTVKLEGERAPDSEAACPAKSERLVTESLVYITRDKPLPTRTQLGRARAPVARGGEFRYTGFRPGKLHVSALLPDDGWYVRSITRTEAGKKAPVDVARDGLALSAGQAVEGVVVTVSAGAAGVAGKIVPAAEGQAVPDGVRVHLVPAEADAGDAVVRFYEVKAERDGTFEIRNVAPGAYRALAVEDKAAGDEAAVRPAAWDAATRAALRKAAAALPELQLAPCAREKTLELKAPSRPH